MELQTGTYVIKETLEIGEHESLADVIEREMKSGNVFFCPRADDQPEPPCQ